MSLKSKLTTIKHKGMILLRPVAEFVYRTLAHLRYLVKFLWGSKHPLPGKLIVSLTSYPPRFSTLHLTLKTLLSQSVTPDVVILWLYQGDLEKITPEVKKLVGDKFEIRTVEKDIKSYKKLIPALEAFPEAFIVTADDDIYYGRNWLRDLVLNYRMGVNEVVGHRAHMIGFGSKNQILPYKEWQFCISSSCEGPRVFLTTGAGVLYPPRALSQLAMDSDTFMKLCPTNDDIWFYFLIRVSGYQYRRIIGDYVGFTWKESQSEALYLINIGGGMNDKALVAMVDRFGSPL
jgi:hypothetical protein